MKLTLTITFLAGFVLGGILVTLTHPYEECKRMYNTPEDIMECVWIKENP